MDHYCVLGNPVEHSKSPLIQARFAELTGQALAYGKQWVALDGFAAMLAELQGAGTRGCNVTVPFKFEAFQAAHSHSARARLAQAANTLRFDPHGIHADNTDGVGLVNDIENNAGVALAGRDLLLLGAGGAAAGVLGEILARQPRRVVVANRTADKAALLVERHRAVEGGTRLEARGLADVDGDFDIVVNATASSLAGAEVPVPASVLKPGALAYDMMYGPAAQAFLAWADAHGATGRDGLGMLVEQAAEAFWLWRGVRPPAAQVLAEMRALLQPAGAAA